MFRARSKIEKYRTKRALAPLQKWTTKIGLRHPPTKKFLANENGLRTALYFTPCVQSPICECVCCCHYWMCGFINPSYWFLYFTANFICKRTKLDWIISAHLQLNQSNAHKFTLCSTIYIRMLIYCLVRGKTQSLFPPPSRWFFICFPLFIYYCCDFLLFLRRVRDTINVIRLRFWWYWVFSVLCAVFSYLKRFIKNCRIQCTKHENLVLNKYE